MNCFTRYALLLVASVGCFLTAKTPLEHRAEILNIVSNSLKEVNKDRPLEEQYTAISDMYSKALGVTGAEKIELNKQVRLIANAISEHVSPDERAEMNQLIVDYNRTPLGPIGSEGYDIGVRLGEKMTPDELFIARVIYYSLYIAKAKYRLGNSLFKTGRYLGTASIALGALWVIFTVAYVVSHQVNGEKDSLSHALKQSALYSMGAYGSAILATMAATLVASWYTKDIDVATDEEVVNLGFGPELVKGLENRLEDDKNYFGYYDTTWGWFCSLFRELMKQRIERVKKKTNEVNALATQGAQS